MNDKAVVAWIAPGTTSMFFTTSMNLMLARDMGFDRHLVNILPMHCGVNIAHGRNDLTRQFLDDWPQADWLLWIDSDMEFQPETMHDLIACADPVEYPIVGALCFGEDAETGLFPTVYQFAKTAEGAMQCIRLGDYPEDAMFEVAATGAAFLLIHRTALEAIRAKEFNSTFPFFQELEMDGNPVGEDIAFCARARATRTETWPNGIPVFVNTAISVGHHKSHILTAEKFQLQKRRQAWAPPATERVQVIVPTLHRPKNAQRFMDSLRASTSLAEVFAVCDPDDHESALAWNDAGANVLKHGHTFAEKNNYAAGKSSDPWIFITGDDVMFRPGWLDQAQAAAEGKFDVIGTNDLGNPRTMRGEHATHILIRRSYIDEVGASWDGPGIVCHEGYGHWFVDDEIVTAAKRRGVWNHSADSIVEHFHPLFGKAEEDETYLEGQKTRFEDEALFVERSKANR